MLTTPIMILTSAWDAADEHVFQFNVIGGDQVVKNRLVIRDQETNNIVYDGTQTTFKYEHIVSPPNDLSNGKYYTAQIQTFNAQDESSALSLPIQFWCYNTPTITFSNIPVDNVIRNVQFSFEFIYDQSEGELLDYWIMDLYDSSDHVISSSGQQFPSSQTTPFQASYLFDGLNDNSTYSVMVYGETINGTDVNSETITFTVDYERPSQFGVIQLENNPCDGYIRITSNAAIIDGKSNPSPPEYIKDCTMADLRKDGYWVMWDEGYRIDGDWTLRIWGSEFNIGKPIFIQWTSNNSEKFPEKLEIYYNESNEGISSQLYSFFKIKVYYKNKSPYVIYTNFIDVVTDEQIFLCVKRIDNMMDAYIENMGVV